MSHHILTYSKIKFYPLEPEINNINIQDIAHSLSLLTRANGHFVHFYSVAQHSVNCFKEAKSRGYSERVQLGCLLHDASESYISDLTRPVKRCLPEYFTIEERLQKIIFDKFGLGDLSDEELEQIQDVDDTLLHLEFDALMEPGIFGTSSYSAMEHDFSQRPFISVEKEYISVFNRLMGLKREYKCVGIDGCKGGWVAVSITDTEFEVDVFRNIEEFCLKYDDWDRILIDMPIGLPECNTDIRPDGAARKMLKGKTSSIFNTPCRQAVYADTYSEANEINRQMLEKGLSSQSYAICSKIKEIDEFLNNNPEYKNRILESHPELCFARLNSGEPLYDNKKTYEGMRKRIELLSRYCDQTDDIITYARDNPKLKNCMDDVVDSLCLAVTGMRSMEKGIKTIPENPMVDKNGILMQMVYADEL